MKMKKIKDVVNSVDIVTGQSVLFDVLKAQLRTYLTGTMNIDTNVYDSSLFKNIFGNDVSLSIQYFVERSNDKKLSPLFYKMLKMVDDEEITEEQMYNSLSTLISQKYAFKWWKICDALTTDYEPLENYDLNEERKVNTDVNVHQETESGYYGFNSTEAQPTATGEGDTHTTGLESNNKEVLRRHGNIGVTTSQQMLESELKLRQYNFIEEVLNDIDSILCLKIY